MTDLVPLFNCTLYSQEILANYLSSLQLDPLRAEGNVIRDKEVERLSHWCASTSP